jgi:hypothetical protein
MNMLDVIKNHLNLDAHMYEIDKTKLKNVYNFDKKIKKEYKIVEKKLIFSADNNANKENKYYSNYKYFREYLRNGFESDDLGDEISEISELLKYSKNLREELEKIYEINIDKNYESNNVNYNSNNKTSFNKFIKMCKLLTPKDKNSEDDDNNRNFKFYSELNKPSDIFSFTVNENGLNNNLLNSKKLLTEGFNQEEFLHNFAKNYNKKNSDILKPEIKRKLPNEYINSIFRSRDNEAFINIDAFMSTYGPTQKANLSEKDLFENIYSMLSKSKHINFLSFLYSKNDLFKFIYDDFVIRKASIATTLDDMKLSRIDSVETDRFFKGENLSIHPERIQKKKEKNVLSIDELLGSTYFFDKVSFLNERIDPKLVEPFIKYTNDSPPKSGLNMNLAQYLKILNMKENNFLFQITKTDKLKLTCLEDDGSGKLFYGDIEEPLKKVCFHKIRNDALERMNTFEEVVRISSTFMILEISNTHFRRNSDSFTLTNFGYNSSYYLLKISNENLKKYEIFLENFKLYTSPGRRLTRGSTVQFKEFSKKDTIYVDTNTNKSILETNPDVFEKLKDSPEKLRGPRHSALKQNRANSIKGFNLEDDFLGRNNKDILTEVLRSKKFGRVG